MSARRLKSFVEIFFFFSSRRRHTRLQGDWSSDVCSSDLVSVGTSSAGVHVVDLAEKTADGTGTVRINALPTVVASTGWTIGVPVDRALPVADRKSVVEGKSVDLGGRRIIKKKKKRIRDE